MKHYQNLLEKLIQNSKCPKCSGKIDVDSELLPDNTYELYCLMCGNRTFPTELVVIANMFFKLNKTKNNDYD